MRYLMKPVCWECFQRFTRDTDDSTALCRALGIKLPKTSIRPRGADAPGSLIPGESNTEPASARTGVPALAGSLSSE